MKTTPLALLVVSVLLTSAFLPPSARTQEPRRGVGVSTSQTGAGGYHALVIGNNDYKSLPRLKTAEADAREVAALLKDVYGFETRLLTNATRGQIMSALGSYRRTLGPEANLLVYYAGHGFNDKDADKAYWLPVDAARDDPSNWIIADEITTGIKVLPARHVLVVSDSCYSGTLTRGLGEALPPAAGREQFLQRMAAGHSRTLMASGGDEPVADGGGGGSHSVFANALLRGLRQMDKERFTAAELFRNYVEEAVAGRAEQVPEYNPLRNSGHESGDFVFVRVKTDGKTVEVTVNRKPPAAAVDPSVFELEFWNAIKDSSDPEEYKDYLKRYPDGRFAEIARRRAAGGRGGNNTAGSAPAASSAVANPPPTTSGASSPSPARPKADAVVRNRVGMELVYVPPGSFMMGAEYNTYANEKPRHQVTIRAGFYVGKYEVTQEQWKAVMGNNPSKFRGDNLPVEFVSWDDTQNFIQKLNEMNDGFLYRLPSESEWEYAARGRTEGEYADDQESMAWGVNSGKKTHPVGQKRPNDFGVYDMLGNVWEWCEDYYHDNYNGAPSDGSAWLSGGESNRRIFRGGSWQNYSTDLRFALRSRAEPAIRAFAIGFRVVAVARQ